MNRLYNIDDYRTGIRFTRKNGFKQVMPQMISAGYSAFRGSGMCCYVIGKMSYTDTFMEIQKGYISTEKTQDMETKKRILVKQNRLMDVLEGNNTLALSAIKENHDFYTLTDGKNEAVYVLCDGGVIGAAWNGEEQGSKKGKIMAAFLCYALGFINPDVDPVLWTSTYKYLLYESGLGDPMEFDLIILEAMKNSIKT